MSRPLSPSRPSLRLSLSALTALALLSLNACADQEAPAEELSGKKKIAYAPYQRAKITHHAPAQAQVSAVSAASEAHSAVTQAVAQATLNPSSPSTLTSEGLAQAATTNAQNANPQGPQHGSALAAGWPGAQSGQKPTPQPTQQQAAPAQPSALPAGHPPAPTSRPAQPTSLPTSQPTSQPTSRPAHPTSQPSGPAVASNYIYGQLELDPTLTGKIKEGSVLFVIVRRHVEGGAGMLIAATKLSNVSQSTFPMPFVVKQQDAMMGAPLVGNVTVSARIDQDGDAISKQPGDLVGEAAGVVVVGKNPVKFSINKSL